MLKQPIIRLPPLNHLLLPAASRPLPLDRRWTAATCPLPLHHRWTAATCPLPLDRRHKTAAAAEPLPEPLPLDRRCKIAAAAGPLPDRCRWTAAAAGPPRLDHHCEEIVWCTHAREGLMLGEVSTFCSWSIFCGTVLKRIDFPFYYSPRFLTVPPKFLKFRKETVLGTNFQS